MSNFLSLWNEAATTSLGFFWMALWAFILGYVISSLIQVLVTRRKMQQAMGGEDGPRSIALGTFFGFISSSCSFSALATTRAIFNKGAGLAPSLAFMLASTNLVIELGIVIAVFLGWQFVVGEYVGGVLLILVTWLLIRLTRPRRLEAQARRKMDDGDGGDGGNSDKSWKEKITSKEGWQAIAQTYVMEWQMVWKDVLIGFTVAGIISAMVPQSFFEALFIGAGGENAANPASSPYYRRHWLDQLQPFSPSSVPWGEYSSCGRVVCSGSEFCGRHGFIFSDLVVLPVLRINASYYGWKMALYILALMLVGIVTVSLLMHYSLALLGMLPDFSGQTSMGEREFFKWNYQAVLNILFLTATAILLWFWRQGRSSIHMTTTIMITIMADLR